ncbi:MAG: permease [Acidobacteriaceae bacterium]
MRPAVFNLRAHSLFRGTSLVLISLAASLRFSGFPHVHTDGLLAFAALGALWGTYETLRCLRLRWSFYHGGVMLLLYMDVMALTMIFFLFLYPYADWIQ